MYKPMARKGGMGCTCEQQQAAENCEHQTVGKCARCIWEPYWVVGKEQQPAAESVRSLTDESVKPCPFCGKIPKIPKSTIFTMIECPGHMVAGIEKWNNAWVWKQISALSEERNAAHRRIAELERRNAELEKERFRLQEEKVCDCGNEITIPCECEICGNDE